MIRVADYTLQFLADRGIRHIFLVTGGGAMHLNDAIGRETRLQYVCCHHEQACSIAAESYARAAGVPAVVSVTSGPGGINALNGVFGAWVDSIPMLVLSGQVKRATLLSQHGLDGKLRQLGDQEAEIVRMAGPITKYAAEVCDPGQIRYHLERAFHSATHGRPGPCWLDIPIDVQGSRIDPETLAGWNGEEPIPFAGEKVEAAVQAFLSRLATAQRPVVYAGGGIRSSGQHRNFLEAVERLGIPIVTAWNHQDLLWESHPCYAGIPGSVGTRPGNFAVQNADLLLILGCRLNIRLVSYNWENFAREAYKIWVDIDAQELDKPTVKPDLPVHADLKDFIPALLRASQGHARDAHAGWLEWCKACMKRYPVVLPSYWELRERVNPYCFMDRLFEMLGPDDIVVAGDGTACVTAFQAGKVKKGQRVYHNTGCASMGYDLPAAVGAASAFPCKRIICLAGDGSVMMNLQELQTIRGLNLNVKTFILNNEGYHSIRQTQRNFFPDNIVGCGTDSGLTFPDWETLAQGFRMPFFRCGDHAGMEASIASVLAAEGPVVCEVVLDLAQEFAPKLSSRKLENGQMVTAPLEDMAPFLSREELKNNLFITMKNS